jgi:hypothetical protein
MRLCRFALVFVVAVAGVTALVPALRDQARLQLAMLPRPGDAAREPTRDPVVDWLVACSDTALDFARAHPNDPEFLLAAALIASDRDAARAALRELTTSNGRSVAWSVYLDEVLAQTPLYYREETAGIHPGDTRALAEARRLIDERNLCTALTADEATRVIEAAQEWQQIDPENALPVALEAWSLWGLHRDEEALEKWTAASRLPRLSAYVSERIAAMSHLLVAMGGPPPEAILAARFVIRSSSLDLLAPCAFAASYAGHCAVAAGEPEQALLCWQSTIELGIHAHETAESVPGFQAGAGLARLGAWHGSGLHPYGRSGQTRSPAGEAGVCRTAATSTVLTTTCMRVGQAWRPIFGSYRV